MARHLAREIPADLVTARSWPAMLFRHLPRSAQVPASPALAEQAPASAVPATPAQFSLLPKAQAETETIPES